MNKKQYFSQQLLDWFDLYGRKTLPWQQPASPYRVWLSEIMLQQTQVSTVIPYFLRFIKRFPDVASLAAASSDEVLQYWSGLGYYARGRNLHKAAQLMAENYQAQIPADFQALLDLPGIGRSTAGAIMALAFKQRYPILDGNVKRVLGRFSGESRWPGNKQAEKDLWTLAQTLLPDQRINDYIQAQMDLGATVCTRTNPDCQHCPLQQNCLAWQSGKPTDYPGKKAKQTVPHKQTRWLVYYYDQCIFLEKRPQTGIWGGLWSFPELSDDSQIEKAIPNDAVEDWQQLEIIQHAFTHFRLTITPVLIRLQNLPRSVNENTEQRWVKITETDTLGLPAPVKTFIQTLQRGYPWQELSIA